MRTVITKYKMLILATGKIKEFTFPHIMAVGRLEYIANLNNAPLTFGIIYYVDSDCIKLK